MPGNKQLSQTILKLSDGVASTMVDLTLTLIFNLGEFSATPRHNWWQIDSNVQDLIEKYNYQTLKTNLNYLFKKDYLKPNPNPSLPPILTPTGLKRLQQTTPQYHHHRPWDKKFYLISYDIPRQRNSQRDQLRRLLKTNGCAKLQHSLWITPYHPQTWIKSLVENKNLSHLLAVSTMDTTIGVGKTNPKQLMAHLYPLDKLNHRYQNFINWLKTKPTSPTQISFKYFSILQNDPQLPFKLLPKNWQGDRAHQAYSNYTHRRLS